MDAWEQLYRKGKVGECLINVCGYWRDRFRHQSILSIRSEEKEQRRSIIGRLKRRDGALRREKDRTLWTKRERERNCPLWRYGRHYGEGERDCYYRDMKREREREREREMAIIEIWRERERERERGHKKAEESVWIVIRENNWVQVDRSRRQYIDGKGKGSQKRSG